MSNCCANSASVLSPRTAAKATFALKAGVWFRRGRFVMVSPVRHTSWPLSGRNSTYPAVQISKASSDIGITVGDKLALDNASIKAETTNAPGGRITVATGRLFDLHDSQAGQSGEARIFLIQDDNLTAEVPLRRSILQSTLRQKYRSTGRHNPQRDGGPEKGLYRLHPIALGRARC